MHTAESSIPSTPTERILASRRRGRKQAVQYLFYMILLVALACWQAEVDLIELFSDLPDGFRKTSGFLIPEWGAFPVLLGAALFTFLLALIPTPLGVVLAFFFAICASRNLVPLWLRNTFRGMITLKRAIPEYVTMILLAAALGLGALPGIAAIAIGTIGMLGKVFADAIEEIDERLLDSFSCVGADFWQKIRFCVLPEIMPVIIAQSLFRIELNMRAAGLLGAVGAGGIGYEISRSMMALDYDRVSSAILVTLAFVYLIERGSDALRQRILKDEKHSISV
jgi:phosphonate transport system permease protein